MSFYILRGTKANQRSRRLCWLRGTGFLACHPLEKRSLEEVKQ